MLTHTLLEELPDWEGKNRDHLFLTLTEYFSKINE